MLVCIENIIEELRKHNVEQSKLNEVLLSFNIAKQIHGNQFRQSGEPYIVHPLWVAQNLLDMEVYDPDTISAALLHDTIEDAEIDFTKEDVAELINPTVAELVDGVTKIGKMKFSSIEDELHANTRKIINGLIKDIRIILIKLADRLHNMRTLEFKKPEKQLENAKETMQLFVPIALALGAYTIKSQLEDLSLKYIDPDEYKKITEQKYLLAQTEYPYLQAMKEKLSKLLEDKEIENEIILREKNVCTTYKKIKQGYRLENMYDLFYLKILVPEIDECYRTLALVHQNNRPINGRFKDYIFNPRTNMYQSLHTTVSDQNGKLVKTKVRTFDMNRVAAFGVSAYWNIKDGKTIEETQELIRNNLTFGKKLKEINRTAGSNQEFYEEISNQLLTEHVYVYNKNGEIIELPNGSTVFDFACQVVPELIDDVLVYLVNGKEVKMNHILHNNDGIELVVKDDCKKFDISIATKQKLLKL